MSKKWKCVMILMVLVIAFLAFFAYWYRWEIYLRFTSRGLNQQGGDLTIINGRIWTGDPKDPWKSNITIRNGKIVALDSDKKSGKVIDAEGRLIVPGFWDGHTHPQAPYVLTSPEAPTLFQAKTVQDVQKILSEYVKAHPEDRFPRLFGWMQNIFKEGEKPTRQLIDAVVSDRPVYLVNHGGHEHWANTKALELAGVLEKDPTDMRGNGHIERDPTTGLATGYLGETEYAATHGILLNAVRKLQPYGFEQEVLIQRAILEEYPKVGVTSIWVKDGDIHSTRVYEKLLKLDTLPVRAVLDNLYSPYSDPKDIAEFAARAEELKISQLPAGFLRTDAIKLVMDLPIKGWIWMFDPYEGETDKRGASIFPLEQFRAQVLEADTLGLQINICALGDCAVHESLNILETLSKLNPSHAPRRPIIEHAEYVQDHDLQRFQKLDVIASVNPINSYPDPAFQARLKAEMGEKRLHALYQRYKDLNAAGALVVGGSDFPLAPFDPLIGMHIVVNGTDIEGKPEGGLWPHKQVSIEEALRFYTVNPAYAARAENTRGKLKVGYDADLAMLSENILDPNFNKTSLGWIKVNLTVLNGHVVYEDFTKNQKVIDFGK